ncbi:hypothetical protein [Sediminibacterium sp.]|uniref:hypothetical protein n=1 Tax=Sediminibacterium sp. TaxID=1917865 RepID=UPI00272FFBD1|nr:hypothetical protein [Sediminibacterium sp.]MDP1972505.1 hypothetical protein [Sediminibacterium sp.]MDP2421288.1 hypothetical protein [Sediminibacterium sp.]
MERVGTLINKLQEQFNQQADADKLAITAQLLLAELQMLKPINTNRAKVAVVMPQVAVSLPLEMPAFVQHTPKHSNKKEEATGFLFGEYADIPTLIHQPAKMQVAAEPVKEINELLALDIPEMNEHLNEYAVEVSTMLDETPVRDLKKAISINDRYLFINHLFRGDENMYERSIRTINGFNIFPEAQYWIQRELKVKLSWLEDNPTVQLFDQLVKRRFA